MQKFRHWPAEVTALLLVSRRIGETLAGDRLYDEDEAADIVNDLYGQRQSLIDQLKIWLESSAGNVYIAEHRAEWNQLMKELMEQEREHQKIILESSDFVKTKLRELVHKRSILLYSKG